MVWEIDADSVTYLRKGKYNYYKDVIKYIKLHLYNSYRFIRQSSICWWDYSTYKRYNKKRN